ncbi:glycoside hydrolase family 71/99-like protein [Streptomyces sp. NPDC004134]|uniref:glycoside hydrolase family 71/99-like protein n=1 Tax=Streptomyces sp. NPDC004134 TaxID=3364691 RepID=UPI0036A8345D
MHESRPLRRFLTAVLGLTLLLLTGAVPLSSKADAAPGRHTVTGQVYAGYQGWFNAPGDGSPRNSWRHWANNSAPSPGNQSFELYPDMTAYPASARFQTGYAPLGNGQPATLFSSYPTAVVNQHFSWMQSYGIDGAALQRFGVDLLDPVSKQNRDTITDRVRDAAEAHDRGFYVEYDISGLTDANVEQTLKNDWTSTVTGTLDLTSSPSYAHEDGRPVVGIFGFGYTSRPGTAETALRVIRWFQDQGAYVIGAVPHGWRTGGGDTRPGFAPVYQALDMLSPWLVGNVGDILPRLRADRADLDSRGQAYQPVIYPGFAWSNWNGGPRNQIPRNGGGYLWGQAVAVREAGIPQAFIAMFDEYDEATAIAPAASDSSMAPANQYFLTLSADGTYVSPDFYLRLSAEASRMITGDKPLVRTVPIPPSTGPDLLRTGTELQQDVQPTWTDSIGPGGSANVTGASGTGAPTMGTVTGADRRTGQSALRLQGSTPAPAHSYAYFRAFDVDIPVTSATRLSYDFLPKNENGRSISVDFVTTDGTTLRDSSATTTTGIDMHPGAPKGTVGSWTTVQSNFGPALAGKTIDTVLIAYDRTGATGGFGAFIDNLAISTT